MNVRQLLPFVRPAPFLITLSCLSARDLLPERWMENIPAADGSVQQSLVFRTIAGVDYRVEWSNDLIGWETESEIYGLGHEYVVGMRQFAPPPPLPPGSPPVVPPPRPIAAPTLIMRPSSGAQGGTVVTWKSLDHGGPMAVLLEEDMHEDWTQVPFFSKRYDAYYFFIWHPVQTIAPPSENSPLGTRDAAMITQLETSFADMNLLVAQSAAAIRNAPEPAPMEPGPKKFWRIVADWGIDTDTDGTPDWAEFAIAANTSHPSHALGNAFNADANNDGNPDQLDADQDGIFDIADANLDVEAVDWEKAGTPRFALFTLPPMQSPFGFTQYPLHVTDLGYIVFPYGLWSKGSYASIDRDGNGTSNCQIWGMNDLLGGQIVGTGTYDSDGDETPDVFCHVSWPGPEGSPAPVAEGDTFAVPAQSGVSNAGHFLAEDGSFIGGHASTDEEGNLVLGEGRLRWTLAILQGGETSSAPAPSWATSNYGPDLVWNGSQATIFGSTTELPHPYSNVVLTPSGSVIACSPFFPPAIFRDGVWREEASLPGLVDFSQAGFGGSASPVQIWSDGRVEAFADAAPDLPTDWRQRARLLDISDRGNLLLARDSNSGSPDAYALGVPFILEDDVEAAGVDVVSITSTSPGPGIDKKLWIMAPASGENVVRFKTTAAAVSCPLALTASSAAFDPSTLNNPNQLVTVSATGGSPSGDQPLTITNGASQSITTPIGIKVMKKRIVRVKVYTVAKQLAGGASNPPDMVPSAGGLQTHLNNIFKPQINVTFDVHPDVDQLLVAWDANGDQVFEVGGADSHSEEQDLVLDEIPTGQPASDIRIFIMGGGVPLDLDALGATNRVERACWVMGDTYRYQDTVPELMNTIAHEIGHIFVGYGHPDEENTPLGPAPLPGTNFKKRLMISGTGGGENPGKSLVKQEWDAAEIWLNSNIGQSQ